MDEPRREVDFHFLRTVKIGTFYIGSSAVDLLVSGVWNRVMIVDLGIAAWPVALLGALRYFLAPLSLWAGHRADTHPIRGSRRLAYIWIGRALVLISLPLIPLSTGLIANGLGLRVALSTPGVCHVWAAGFSSQDRLSWPWSLTVPHTTAAAWPSALCSSFSLSASLSCRWCLPG